ncbi:MAG: response regulator transcription factor [Verrucomicrobiales bacterium]
MDLALIDFTFNGIPQIDLIKTIRGCAPRAKIIVILESVSEATTRMLKKVQIDGMISPKISKSEFIQMAARLEANKNYIEPEISNALARAAINGQSYQLPVEQLSSRETAIFYLVGSGIPNAEIADQLGISCRTVESHKARIKAKLNLPSMAQVVREAVKWSGRPKAS